MNKCEWIECPGAADGVLDYESNVNDRTWSDDVNEFNARESLPVATTNKPKPPPDPKRQKRGRTGRKRGLAFERWCVNRAKELGLDDAHRRFGDKPSGDIGAGGEKIECKSGYGGMKTIHRWLAGNYAVVYEALQDKPGETKPPTLVFMRYDDFIELLVDRRSR